VPKVVNILDITINLAIKTLADGVLRVIQTVLVLAKCAIAR
jgi:hypothetical protein